MLEREELNQNPVENPEPKPIGACLRGSVTHVGPEYAGGTPGYRFNPDTGEYEEIPSEQS